MKIENIDSPEGQELIDDIFTIFENERFRELKEGVKKNEELKNAEILNKLYNKNLANADYFKSIIKYTVNSTSCSYLSFDFFLRQKDIKIGFEELSKTAHMDGGYNTNWIKAYYRIYYLVDNNFFTKQELREILRYLLWIHQIFIKKIAKTFVVKDTYYTPTPDQIFRENLQELYYECEKLINFKQMEILIKEVGKDIDKEEFDQVINLLENTTLDKDFKEGLLKLQKLYYDSQDKIDFAKNASSIRPLFSALIKDIAIDISKKNGTTLRENMQDEQYKEYLKELNILGPGEIEMINGLYQMNSNYANHKFKTDKDYFRVLFNMCLSIVDLILVNYNFIIKEKDKNE